MKKKFLSGSTHKDGVPLTRLDFMKLSALFAASTLLAACAPQNTQDAVERWALQPEFEPTASKPTLAFFLAMTGLQKDSIPGLETVIANELQRDNLMAAMIGNQMSVADGSIVTDAAVAEGRAIGASLCSDSRGKIFSNFRAMIFGESTRTWVTDARQAGAQPSIFRPGVTKSLFISHEALPFCGFGCGYLGGAEEVLLYGNEGVQKLLAHGVPQETITHILNWKELYGKAIQFEKLTPDEWAEIGGRIQAYINGKAKGENHMVLFGVQEHGTGGFRPLGFVDETGRTISLSQGMELYPQLSGAADFLNQPHPAIESLVAGQQPNINIMSVSKHSTQALFGEGVIKPGEAFVISHPAETISAESLDVMIRDLVASQGYSVGALKQRGNMIFLAADNADDMIRLRQSLLGSSFSQEFLNSGGLIVELITNPVTGEFERRMVLRTSTGPVVLSFSQEEEILARVNVNKIKLTGVTKIIERADDMLVMVESTVDGKTYEISLPKGSTHSQITSELLVARGMPPIEALWYERALVGLGKTVMVAGAVLLAYDGFQFTKELLGYGESMQLATQVDVDMPTQLHQAIINAGLENTIVNRGLRGQSLLQVQGLLTQRGFTFNFDQRTPYYLKLDSPIIGIPFHILDDKDVALPIVVEPLDMSVTAQTPDGLMISRFQYRNLQTGETMIITYDPVAGVYYKDGPDYFSFTVPAVTYDNFGNPTYYEVPVTFNIGNLDGQFWEYVMPDLNGSMTRLFEKNESEKKRNKLKKTNKNA